MMKYQEYKLYEASVKELLNVYRNRAIFFQLKNAHPNPILNAVFLTTKYTEQELQRFSQILIELLKSGPIPACVTLQVTVYCSNSFQEQDYLVNYYPYQWEDSMNIPVELKNKLRDGIEVTVLKHTTIIPLPRKMIINKIK